MLLDRTYWANKVRERSALALIGACVVGLYAGVAMMPGGGRVFDGQLDKVGLSFLLPERPKTLTAPELDHSVTGEGVKATEVYALFNDIGYTLDRVSAGEIAVPRVAATDLPSDLRKLHSADERKHVFILTLLPLILMENEAIQADRERLLLIKERKDMGKPIGRVDAEWVAGLMQTYRVKRGGLSELLNRIDVIPPSLAIAQAAQETGWGTSRFAQLGNALFGQWVWGDDAKGIVPTNRKSGLDHKIKAFDTPGEAVHAFFLNLNRHRAYAPLRMLRTKARAEGATLSGLPLAAGLLKYSEMGGEYVMAIRRLIDSNGLSTLDDATLDNGKVTRL